MSEEINQVMHQLFTAWASRDIEAICQLCANDYEGINVAEANPQQGPAGMRQALTYYLQAFPSLKLSGEKLVEGNRVALFWTAHATHRGNFMNIPPTGREVRVRGTALLTIEKGRIKAGLYIWDVAELLRACGLLPELKHYGK